jgi:hypothetical protein
MNAGPAPAASTVFGSFQNMAGWREAAPTLPSKGIGVILVTGRTVIIACLVVSIWVAGTATATAGVHRNPCSSQRHIVATLQDKPNLLPVKNTTLGQLARLPTPRRLTQARLAEERHVYRITAQVTSVQQEASGDLRILISDGAGHTMTVNAPSLACTNGATVSQRRQMAKARTAVTICSDAVLTGVLFYTLAHHQVGEAPNGIELNPLLSFSCLAPNAPLGH